jgi:hypothetical protein
MRVLFLPDTGIPDFLQDAVFHGLYGLLGGDVIEWPPLERYRGGDPPADERYPFLYFDLPPHPGGSLDELVEWSDAVVMPSLRKGALPHVRAALGKRPSAFVDGEDHPYVHAVRSHVDLYFKRETLLSSLRLRARMPPRRLYHRLRNRAHGRDPLRAQVAVATTDNVIPLPFAAVDVAPDLPREKKYDVAFLARATSPERQRVLAELEGLGLRVATGVGSMEWREYMEVIARSRVGISVRGLGYDTQRYWEIPYARTALLAETPKTVIPRNFVDGEEALFAPLDGLVARVETALARADELAERGHEAVYERHMSVHRAQQVLERLDAVRRRRG